MFYVFVIGYKFGVFMFGGDYLCFGECGYVDDDARFVRGVCGIGVICDVVCEYEVFFGVGVVDFYCFFVFVDENVIWVNCV